jgi:hypothetical protein
MLQSITAAEGPRFALYVHHADGEREWAYDRKSSFGIGPQLTAPTATKDVVGSEKWSAGLVNVLFG